MRLVLHPGADAEITEALEYYKLRNVKIANDFYRAYLHTRQLVCDNPLRYPVVRIPGIRIPGIRKHGMLQFPYNLIYRLTVAEGEQCLQILAIAHHRRRPYYWEQRSQ
jgi:toxin ParE1/3/4